MKPIILYESKHGATKKCATHLHDHITGSTLSTIQDWDKDLQSNHYVILGTPVYMGQFNKHVKAFLNSYEEALLKQPFILFYSAMNEEGLLEVEQQNIPAQLQDHATVIHVGGAYDFSDMKWWERFIVKKLAKVSESLDHLYYEKLEQIIKQVNA